MKRTIAFFVSLAVATSAFAGVGADKAVYRGGTIAMKAGDEGTLDLGDPQVAVFRLKESPNAMRIPYQAITSIEYGQKAGRRVGAAVATAILVTPIGLALLFSHKRRHIVTLTWSGAEGKSEAAVFEVGKNAIRPMLASLAARSGRPVEYESEDAKKNIGR